jgi:hypothetical protein
MIDLGTSWRWVVRFTPQPLHSRKIATSTHWMGGWVGPRTSLDGMEGRKILHVLALETPTPWPTSP